MCNLEGRIHIKDVSFSLAHLKVVSVLEEVKAFQEGPSGEGLHVRTMQGWRLS